MKTEAKSSLKRIVITTIGGLLFMGLLAAGISTIGMRVNFTRAAQAQEDTTFGSARSQRPFRCSNATLAGSYAVMGSGFVPNGPPSVPMVPFANMSLMTLDGAGNLSNKVTVSRNGEIIRNVDPGIYSVNADCTGTMTINLFNPTFQLTFDLVVAEFQGAARGKEFYFIATSGGVVTHTAKRIQ